MAEANAKGEGGGGRKPGIRLAAETEVTTKPERSPWCFLAAEASSETIIERSRFLARLLPLEDAAQAAGLVAGIRKQHPGARHHCTALIVGRDAIVQRSSDDGEPSGTAGLPMLEVLRKRHVTGVLAVVTRYFGGILLGAGGLVRAYSGAVASALNQARLEREVPRAQWHLLLPAGVAGRAENQLRRWVEPRGGEVSVRYGTEVEILVTLDPEVGADFGVYTAERGLTAKQSAPVLIRVPLDEDPSTS